MALSLTIQIRTPRLSKCELRCRIFTWDVSKTGISSFPWPGSFLLFVSSVKFISPCFCHGMLSLWKLVWFHIPENYGFRLRGNRLPSKQNLLCWKQRSETWTEDAESNLWWEYSQNWKGRNSVYGLQVCFWHSPEDDGYGRPCHSHLLSASLFRGKKKGSETDISDSSYFLLKMKNICDYWDLISYMNYHFAFYIFLFSFFPPL